MYGDMMISQHADASEFRDVPYKSHQYSSSDANQSFINWCCAYMSLSSILKLGHLDKRYRYTGAQKKYGGSPGSKEGSIISQPVEYVQVCTCSEGLPHATPTLAPKQQTLVSVAPCGSQVMWRQRRWIVLQTILRHPYLRDAVGAEGQRRAG